VHEVIERASGRLCGVSQSGFLEGNDQRRGQQLVPENKFARRLKNN
jgi:hypothetical protein